MRWDLAALDGARHQRGSFSCPDAPELERYLKEQASQDVRRNVGRVFVATPQLWNNVLGYYSLSATSFQKFSLPVTDAKKLPAYPVTAALIGRLAIDISSRKQGLGEYLLMNALERIHTASQVLAVHAVMVDARDDKAERFYRRYGFVGFQDAQRCLFLPMTKVDGLVAH